MSLWSFLGNAIGGLVGAGASIYGANQSVKAQEKANEANILMTRETNQANRDLAEYAYAQNLEQWNRENAYNSPSAQMDRLVQAGLNPNLIYGNSSAGVVSASSPQYQAPEMRAAHVEAAKLNLEGFARSIANIASQTELNTAKAEKLRAETEGTKAKTSKTVTETDFLKASYDERLEFLKDRRLIADSQVQKFSAEAEKYLYDTQAYITAIQQMTVDGKPYSEWVKQSLIDGYKKKHAELGNLEERTKYVIQATANLVKDATLKDDVHVMNEFEKSLNKIGLTRSDDVIYRLLYQGIDLLGEFGLWDYIKNEFNDVPGKDPVSRGASDPSVIE